MRPELQRWADTVIGRTEHFSIGVVDPLWSQRYAAAIDDMNPLYFDEVYARSHGYRGIIAPPNYLATLRGAQEFGPAESELLRVLGMTQSFYEQVRPYVTVYSGAEGIDPFRARRPVLEAIPGITPPLVEALLTAGLEADPLNLPDDQELLTLADYIVPSRELVYTVRALGRTTGGGRFLRLAVIELGGSWEQPFIVYSWGRGIPTDDR